VDASGWIVGREHQESIAAVHRELITQIQRALQRIEAGSYGICERCGQPIPKARLDAFPVATLDVGCKRREERAPR
jgi:DnaK suppressor protein